METGLRELYATKVLKQYSQMEEFWDYCNDIVGDEDPDDIHEHASSCDDCKKVLQECWYDRYGNFLGFRGYRVPESLHLQLPSLRHHCETENLNLSVHFLSRGQIQIRGCDRHGFLKYCANTKDDIQEDELCLVLGLQIAGLSDEEIRKAIDVDRKFQSPRTT